MTIIIKLFHELTLEELYSLLHLRTEVFVVEQNCIYQDMDGKDKIALHILGYKDKELVAYSRVFKPGDYFKEASIGRVLVKENKRTFRYGYKIMEASINTIKERYNKTEIKVSAQSYLKKFYNNLGFQQAGEGYLEDGIPHIAMIRN